MNVAIERCAEKQRFASIFLVDTAVNVLQATPGTTAETRTSVSSIPATRTRRVATPRGAILASAMQEVLVLVMLAKARIAATAILVDRAAHA